MPRGAMLKADIIAELATKTGLSKADVEKVFKAQEALAARELKAGRKFKLGLVTAEPVMRAARAARMGHNPSTGQKMRIPAKPAHKAVKVSATEALKKMV